MYMKYYECDMCGEIRKATINYNPLKDDGWTAIHFDVTGKEIDWLWDEETNAFITYDTIAITQHYCPDCYIRYRKKYYPFIPKYI